jgi:hypothetical protein
MKLNIGQLLLHAVVILFTTACTSDIKEDQKGILTEISLTINWDADPVTRAISDGKCVDKLIYAVMTAEGEFISRSEKILTSGVPSGEVTMNASLVGGKTYKVVCWAQSSKCDAYTVSDDMVLSVDYNGAANDELRDAFYGVSEPFTLSQAQAEVTLRRPFAQLNAGTHTFDWEFVIGRHGYDVKKSAAKVRGVADKLNLLDGTISGSVAAQFTPADLPAEVLKADVDGNGSEEDYTYLFMSYILAGDEPSYHSVDIHFLDEDGMSVMFEDPGLANVKLQRNQRTDFVGQVLSDEGTLNPREYKAETRVYHNIGEDTVLSDIIYDMSGHDALQFASENGQKMTLDNIYITGDIWTIELGEYRGSSYVNYNNELNNVVIKDLIISNGVADQNNFMSVAVCAFGNTTLNNCVMKGTTSTADAKYIVYDLGVRNYSTATINGGEYGRLYFWPATNVTINNSKVGIIDSSISTIKNATSSLVIANGTTVDQINFTHLTNYAPRVTVEAGAVVNVMNLINTKIDNIVINGTVKKFTYNGVEYTWEQLQEMNK